ncbi:UMP kinase [Candidatus Woesearchaeota archaeon]|nr:MAG: UMP kinase [Candidatus Woesearchaeota archaeon]
MKKTVVLSVGGSLINPGKINTGFLKKLRAQIKNSPYKTVLVCGGGKIAREYAAAAKKLGLAREKQDIVGIAATHLNAELVRQLFSAKKVHSKPEIVKEKIIIAAGWKPGCSTDYDAVLWAEKLKAKHLVNLTNTDYIYDKNPKLKGAKPYKRVDWKEYFSIIPKKWKPGLSTPFDPIAARKASKLNLKVACINGKRITQLEKYLSGKKFIGTVIE